MELTSFAGLKFRLRASGRRSLLRPVTEDVSRCATVLRRWQLAKLATRLDERECVLIERSDGRSYGYASPPPIYCTLLSPPTDNRRTLLQTRPAARLATLANDERVLYYLLLRLAATKILTSHQNCRVFFSTRCRVHSQPNERNNQE